MFAHKYLRIHVYSCMLDKPDSAMKCKQGVLCRRSRCPTFCPCSQGVCVCECGNVHTRKRCGKCACLYYVHPTDALSFSLCTWMKVDVCQFVISVETVLRHSEVQLVKAACRETLKVVFTMLGNCKVLYAPWCGIRHWKSFPVSSAHDIFREKTKVGCQRLEKFASRRSWIPKEHNVICIIRWVACTSADVIFLLIVRNVDR